MFLLMITMLSFQIVVLLQVQSLQQWKDEILKSQDLQAAVARSSVTESTAYSTQQLMDSLERARYISNMTGVEINTNFK